MQLIREISRKDFDSDCKLNPNQLYRVRKAARAILLKDNQIGIIDVTKQGIHKIPGGGIEGDEDLKTGLTREILEETGYESKIDSELGLVIEYRDEFDQIQISYVYIAHAVGEQKEVNYMPDELEDGFKFEWIDLDKAEELVEADNPDDQVDNKYINLRDKEIIKFYLKRRAHSD